ncbi:MAG: MBOAT family O-acyltransferase [Tepidisphaeraceae bacterium]
MTFNSLHFVAFFAVVLSGVALFRKRLLARNTFLLLASWYFYGVWDWRFLALLLGTQAFDYTFARLIERYPLGSGKRKWFVVGSCAVNLTVLGFFKYCNFFIDSAVSLAQSLGYGIHRPELNVILPIGISFYTFQSMSYVIDVYRGHLKAERHPLHYALFVAFFPQLVAGPIERATHLLPQIKAPTNMNWDNLCHGFWLVGLGMFKKVVLADNISPVTAGVFDRPDVYPHAWESIVGIYAFAIQIYCDFSAYSDIARGAARMMGFDLMRNFDLPYFAVNPSDFWRRWHISLSTWLRDYLYIPLGGNRGGWFKTYRNLFLTMLLGGLWHGATWLFVLWGAYHGAMLCVHRAVKPWLERFLVFRSRPMAMAWTVLRIVVFFQFTCVGWLLFRGGTLENVKRLLTPLVQKVHHPVFAQVPPENLLRFGVIAGVLFIGQLVKYNSNDHDVIFRIPVPLRAVVYAGMALAILIFGEFGGGSFIYFQF